MRIKESTAAALSERLPRNQRQDKSETRKRMESECGGRKGRDNLQTGARIIQR
jgi:hypothetical protein